MSAARAKKKQRRRAREGGGASAGARPAAASRPAPAAAPGSSSKVQPPRPSRLAVRDTRSPGGSQGAGTRSPGGSQGAGGVPRPQPPWAPFPLTEIGMAVGMAIFVAGIFGDGSRGAWLLVVGVLVLAVVVVELCLREHFAGFRSHTLLLAVLPVAVLDGVMVRALGDALRGPLVLAAALALAAALGWWLRTRFRAAHERAAGTQV